VNGGGGAMNALEEVGTRSAIRSASDWWDLHATYCEACRTQEHGCTVGEKVLDAIAALSVHLTPPESLKSCGAVFQYRDERRRSNAPLSCALPQGHEGPHVERERLPGAHAGSRDGDA
jgi:hypothetical protein